MKVRFRANLSKKSLGLSPVIWPTYSIDMEERNIESLGVRSLENKVVFGEISKSQES